MNIARGNFNQSDNIIFPEYFGRQCSGNAVAAACKSVIIHPEFWTSSTIDDCLISGNNLFGASFESLPTARKAYEIFLRVDELLSTVSFSDGHKVTYGVNIHGAYDGLSLQSVATTDLGTDHGYNLMDYEVTDALTRLFENYTYAMFTCHVETVSIMKLNEKFYLFDSHQRGTNGLTDCQNGKPILMKFTLINHLVNHIHMLYRCRFNCHKAEMGNCLRCSFSIIPLIVEMVLNPSNEIVFPVTESNNLQFCLLSHSNIEQVCLVSDSNDVLKKKNCDEMLTAKKLLRNKKRREKRKEKHAQDSNLKEKEKQKKKERYEKNKVCKKEQMKRKYESDENYRNVHNKKMREKYQVDKDYKNEHGKRMREKYQVDEQYKNEHSKKMREKYQINEEYKKEVCKKMKEKYEVDETYKENVKKQNKKKYNENDDYRKKKIVKSSEVDHEKLKSKECIESIYKNERKETPSHICTSCGHLFFKKSVVFEKNIKSHLKLKIESKCCYRMHLASGNDVAVVCITCFNALKKGNVPKFSVLNGLLFPDVPLELQGLSSLEERLVSARLPFMQIREIGYQKQFGLRGNCINVPININKTVTCLPRMDSEDDTVLVQLMRKMSDKRPYLYENVRPEKVFAAAQYLVSKDFYKSRGITLDEEWLNQFNNFKKKHDNEHKDELKVNNSNEKLIQVNDKKGNGNVDDEVECGQDTLLMSGFVADTCVRMAPGEGIVPIPLLDDDLDVLAFPTVYGGEQREFKVFYNPVEIAKAEARMHDRRVAMNIPKLIMNFCKSRVYKLKSKVSIGLRKKVKTDALTVSQVLDESNLASLIQHNEGYRIVSVDRASPAYWQTKEKKVMAMLRQFGSATLFLTFTCAESRWIPLLICLSKTVYNKIISEEEAVDLSTREKYDLIQKDPVTVARYFVHRFNAFRKLVREMNGPLHPYKIVEDFYRFEMQFRGSVHVHWLAWIENAPIFDPNNANSFEECEAFIDKLITCKKDESLGELLNLQYHKCTKTCKKNVKSNEECRFNYPQAPMRRTRILLPLDENISKDDKMKLKHLYKIVKEKTEKIARIDEDCTFDKYMEHLGISEESYILAIRSSLKRPIVFLRRNVNERKINAYNREMLILWEAHMDIQFIVSPYGCVKYVISYVSKSQKGMSKLLKEVSEQVSQGDEDMCKKLFKIVNAFLNNCEISAQEIALHVLSIPMSRASIGDVYINTVPATERTFMRKSHKELEMLRAEDPNSTNIQEKGLLDHYEQRPDELENVCLADFASGYEFKKYKSKNVAETLQDCDADECNDDEEVFELKPVKVFELKDKSGILCQRRRSKVIRFRRYNEAEDKLNYIRENLMLFVPYRIEPTLEDDVEKTFEKHKDLIRENRSKYCKYDATFDNINVKIEELENDDGDESVKAVQFAIFEIENEQSNFELEMNIPKINRHKICYGEYCIPELKPENEYLESIRMLNSKQKRYLLNCMNIIKTKPNEQFFHFITGGAGVGKTNLLLALVQSMERYWIHELNCDLAKVRLLVCAATGKAACEAGGITINSAFGLGHIAKEMCVTGRKLSASKRNTIAAALIDLRVIIIDEVSLCGYHHFLAINCVLQEVFENNEPFGGISIITVGDFYQLPPVRDGFVFDPPANDDLKKCLDHIYGLIFKMYELTEIMRQKDDAVFAAALNRLRVGRTTEEDNNMFRSRQIDVQGIDITSIWHSAIGLFYQNAKVDGYNNLFLGSRTTEQTICPSFDSVSGTGKKTDEAFLLEEAKLKHHKQTQNLQKELRLCIDARYILTHNLAVPDKLANGATNILRKIIMGKTNTGEIVPMRVYVEFDNCNAGSKTRKSKEQMLKKDNVFESNWIPIERIFRSFSITKNHRQYVVRNQIPIVPAQAQTIHASQGCTYESILADVTNLNRALVYTAIGRAKTLKGVHLLGEFKAPLPATIFNDKCHREMERMRREALLEFDLIFPEDVKNENNKVCIYQNIRSLNLHFPDIIKCSSFICSDVILLVETWSLCEDIYDINGFTIIHRTDCFKKRKAFGTLIYVKNIFVPKVKIVYEKQIVTHSKGHCTVVGFVICEICICLVYKSPQESVDNLLIMLEEFISSVVDTKVSIIYLIGDFNMKYEESDKNFKKLFSFMMKYEFNFILNMKDVSTDHNSLIDLCFSTNKESKAHVFESVVSDHKPVWFEF